MADVNKFIVINSSELDLIIMLLEEAFGKSGDENLFKIIEILIKSQKK